MKKDTYFQDVPKGKEKDRLYYTPKLEHVKVDENSPFIKEIHKLIQGEITEVDLKKVKEELNNYKK